MHKLFSIWFSYLYLYQILEYHLEELSGHIFSDYAGFKLKQYEKKDHLVLTSKVKTIFALTILLQLIATIYILYIAHILSIFFILFLILVYLLSPIYILISATLLYPFETFIKLYVVRKAATKVKNIKDLTIIGVTGCYGKTSTVSYLKTLLLPEFKVFTPHTGYNTLLGISKEINSRMPEDTQILIIEMGDYQRGDIADICDNFTPNISIITSIGSQHLERFKTMENLILSKTEIITHAKKAATIILPPYVFDMPLIPKDKDKIYLQAESKIVDMKEEKLYFTQIQDETLFHTKLLGKHMINDLVFAIQTAGLFGIQRIQAKINMIKQVERRMNPNIKEGVLYIDDTYNIGVESATEAVEFLSFLKEKGRVTKIFVCTGGIVEQGDNSEKANTDYAILLNSIADKVILFPSPFTKIIEEHLEPSIIEKVKNYETFWRDISPAISTGSVVLMQNDIPDAYLI